MKTGTSLAVTLALVVAVTSAAVAQSRPGGGTSTSGTSPSAAPRPATGTSGGSTSGSAPTAGMPSAGGSVVGTEYVLGPGDVIAVSIWKNEALSRVVPVRPDGKISLPLLHDIVAAGLTSMQLRDKIATSLAEFLPNPEVSVTVTEVHSFRVSVLGEVLKPGVYELRSAATVLEAIALAGGLGPFASAGKIAIIRRETDGKTKKVKFNYHRAVAATNADEDNLVLQPGDVIVVP